MARTLPQIVLIALVVLCLTSLLAAEETPARKPGEDVNSPDVRERQGLRPGKNLLFNGWGVTPAGKHLPIGGDLALKMRIAPDHKRLVIVWHVAKGMDTPYPAPIHRAAFTAAVHADGK